MEVEALEKFRNYCSENGHTIPKGYDDEERLLLRYLQDNEWKVDLAWKDVKEHYEWRTSNMPKEPSLYEPYLQSGVFYIEGRDKG